MSRPGRVALVLTLAAGLLTACGAPAPLVDRLSRSAAVHVRSGPGADGPGSRSSTGESRRLADALVALADGVAPSEAGVPDGWTVRAEPDTDILVVEADPDGVRVADGWYALRPGAGPGVVVEVPHAATDLHTLELGTSLFAATHARVLLVATTHRDADSGAADPAHSTTVPFALVAEAVLRRGDRVVQVHGFASRRGDPTEVVVSSTRTPPGPLARRTADSVGGAGFVTCLYAVGQECNGLVATTNTQGPVALAAGADFVHVEVGDEVRRSPGRRAQLVAALTAGLAAA